MLSPETTRTFSMATLRFPVRQSSETKVKVVGLYHIHTHTHTHRRRKTCTMQISVSVVAYQSYEMSCEFPPQTPQTRRRGGGGVVGVAGGVVRGGEWSNLGESRVR